MAYQSNLRRLARLDLIGQMAAGFAHEIRNPLTVVKGYLQFLRPKVTVPMQEQFDLLLNELGRVEIIINDFLSVARGKFTKMSPRDLNSILNDVLPLLSTDAMKQGIDINLQLEENLPALLLSEAEIKQMVLNLARNGIEAMKSHGVLSISTKKINNEVILSIGDTGGGISEEVRGKIFDPFFTTKGNGTGLGLAVCSSIVGGHSATMEVQSAEGQGTTFIIRFPL